MKEPTTPTVLVPYIPNVGLDGIEYPIGLDSKEVHLAEEQLPSYELHEILGSRLVYFKDTDHWAEIGYQMIFHRREN